MSWTFVDYVSLSGATPVKRWFDDLPSKARAKIDDRLLQMESMPKWTEKWASAYKGRNKLIELRIKGPNNIQYRPLGMYHPTRRRCFVILQGAVENGGKIPTADLDVAEKRRDEIQKNPDLVVDHDY